MTAGAGVRLIVGLLLGVFLSADLLFGGRGLLHQYGLFFFPYLFIFLLADGLIGRDKLNDAQVYLLGTVFSLVYLGVYTKQMQTGFALSGIDWAAALGGPLEWGMRLVVWFHCLAALFPRRERPVEPHWAAWGAVGLIGAWAVCVCLFKSYFGYYQGERVLGAFWPAADFFFLGAAWLLWRRLRLSVERSRRQADYRHQNPLWVWAVAGLGVWLLGSGLLARLAGGLEAPAPLFYTVQLCWAGGLGLFAFTSWRDRAAFDDVPTPMSKPVLAAAAFRILGALLILKLFGAGEENPRAGFWSGLLCDLPSKVLFYYAFLTRRLEV